MALSEINLNGLFNELANHQIALINLGKEKKLDLIDSFFPDLPCTCVDSKGAGAIVNMLPENIRTFCTVCRKVDEFYKNYLTYFFYAQREKSTFLRGLFLSLFASGSDPVKAMEEKAAQVLSLKGMLDLPDNDARITQLFDSLKKAMKLLLEQAKISSLPYSLVENDICEPRSSALAKVIASFAVYLNPASYQHDTKKKELRSQLEKLLYQIWEIKSEDAEWKNQAATGIQHFHTGDFQTAYEMLEKARSLLKNDSFRNTNTPEYANLLSYQAHMLLEGSCGRRSAAEAYQKLNDALNVGNFLNAPRRYYESAFFQLFYPDEWVAHGGSDPKKGFLEPLQRAAAEKCMDAILLLADLHLNGSHGCEELKNPEKGMQLLDAGATLESATEHEKKKCRLKLLEYRMQSESSEEAEALYEEAARLGSHQAIVHLREKHFVPERDLIVNIPLKANGSICFFNSQAGQNDRNDILRASLPYEWEKEHHSLVHSRPELLCRGRMLFAFLSDDESQNLLDAVETLKLLNSIARQQEQEEAREALIHRVDMLVLSTDSTAGMILDAAMRSMGEGIYFRLRLCDPDMMAANDLLLHYPTFLPCIDDQGKVRQTSWKGQKNNQICQRKVVILGVSRSAYALVRQMAASTYLDDYPLQLTVAGTGTDQMKAVLEQECPGLFDSGNTAARLIPSFLECDLKTLPLHKKPAENQEQIDPYTLIHEANYLIVAGEQSSENLSLAIKLRTALVKKHPLKGREPYIAVLYPDIRTQWLASRIAVGAQDAAQQYHWTENYGLHLFGSADAFRYDRLMNDPLEKCALMIHLSYYDLTASTVMKRQAMKDYYRRSYNRDSSAAMALGIIYHCFARGIFHQHAEEYAIASGYQTLADRYQQLLEKNGQDEQWVEQGARAEHTRWNGWCYSRGWTAPDDRSLTVYMQMQNPRHHLELGKLHPYIVSYDDLPKVCEKLNRLIDSYQHKKRVLGDPRVSDRGFVQSMATFLTFFTEKKE